MYNPAAPPPPAKPSPDGDLSDLTVEQLAERVLGNYAQGWLDSEQPRLGDRSPRTLIAQGDEESVRELLHAIRYGIFS